MISLQEDTYDKSAEDFRGKEVKTDVTINSFSGLVRSTIT